MNTHYIHIDEFPLFCWSKCQAGDLTFTRRKLNKGNEVLDRSAWESIYDSYLKRFGLSQDSETYYMLMQELTELYKKYAIDGDDFTFNEIEIVLDDIAKLQKDSKFTIQDAIAQVSQWMKTIIDDKKISTAQFFIIQENMKKEIERQNAGNKK